MHVRYLAVVIALVLAVSACASAGPVIARVAPPLIASIAKLAIDSSGKITAKQAGKQLLFDVGPAVGTIVLEKLLTNDKKKGSSSTPAAGARPPKDKLIVKRTINGRDHFQVYRFDSAASKVYVNGTVESIVDHDAREQRIDVIPGTPTTVAILENKPERERVSWDFSLGGWFHDDAVDLDQAKSYGSDDGKRADISQKYSSIVKAVNGATVAKWTRSGTPHLAGCVSLPPNAWGDLLDVVIHGETYCVQTSEGRFGYLMVPGNTKSKIKYRYTLWESAAAS